MRIQIMLSSDPDTFFLCFNVLMFFVLLEIDYLDDLNLSHIAFVKE